MKSRKIVFKNRFRINDFGMRKSKPHLPHLVVPSGTHRVMAWLYGVVMRSSLLFQGSRLGLFCDVSTSRFGEAGLRILPSSFGPVELRLPPLIRREKDRGLRLGRARREPPVTAERTLCPSRECRLFDALSSNDFATSRIRIMIFS